MKLKSLSRVRLLATPWTVAYQAPPSMGFSRQECWSGLPFPSPGDLPDPGIEPRCPALQAGKPIYVYSHLNMILTSPPRESSIFLHFTDFHRKPIIFINKTTKESKKWKQKVTVSADLPFTYLRVEGFPGGSDSQESTCNA